MSQSAQYRPDWERQSRIGIDEAVFCQSKSAAQVEQIVSAAAERRQNLLLTRLAPNDFDKLSKSVRENLDYDALSHTGILGSPAADRHYAKAAVVTAGTSDIGVAKEAVRTLHYHGCGCEEYYDAGVAGLWRIQRIAPALGDYPVVIVVAGMDAALATVVGGLIAPAIIAVPTSVGYGVAQHGHAALHTVLASCAPGIVAVNIDNGYGAACAALRILNAAGKVRDGVKALQ